MPERVTAALAVDVALTMVAASLVARARNVADGAVVIGFTVAVVGGGIAATVLKVSNRI